MDLISSITVHCIVGIGVHKALKRNTFDVICHETGLLVEQITTAICKLSKEPAQGWAP